MPNISHPPYPRLSLVQRSLGALFLFTCSAFSVVHGQQVPIPPTAVDDSVPVIEMSSFRVDADTDEGYGAQYTTGATRINMEIQKAPISVVVLNEQFREDIAAIDIQELARYAAGATATVQLGSGQVSLRGVSVTSGFLRDGMQQFHGVDTANNQALALVERVEIIKGPAGTLFGSHNPGGVVNYVSKVPEYDAKTVVTGLTIPKNNLYNGSIDSTGALGDSGWAYRAIVSAQSGEFFVGSRNDYQAASASLSRRFGANDQGSFLVRFTNETSNFGGPSPWIADASGAVSDFLPVYNPISELDTTRDREVYLLDVEANYRYEIATAPTESRLSVRYSDADQFLTYYSTGTSNYRFLDAAGVEFGNMATASFDDPRFDKLVVDRVRLQSPQEQRAWVINFDTVANFDTGPLSHKLLAYGTGAAVDKSGYRYAATYIRQDTSNPFYLPRPEEGETGPRVTQSDTAEETFQYAYAAQDNISLWDEKLTLVAGLRYDHRVLDQINFRNNTATSNDEREGWTRKFGVVGTPRDWVSLYYNFSETFNPSGIDAITGEVLPNLESTNNELGAKFSTSDGRFSATLALFEITTENVLVSVLVPDPVTGAANFVQRPAGARDIRGWEVDFTAKLFENLSILGGFGQLSTETEVGLVPRNVSEDFGCSVFARYDIPADGWAGNLWVGTGWEHGGERPGDNGNTFFLPEFDMVDFVLGWQGEKLGVQLNVTNVFDTRKAKISTSNRDVMPTEPTTARFSIKYRF